MELEENQEIVLWGWGWEEIGLTLLIHMVLANRTNPLMKKNGRNLMIETILKSLRGKSTWQGIVLAIIVGLLMESNLLINRIRRMIKTDHNLNIDERKAKYRDHEVICEKNWRHKISKYYCEDCFKEETDDREKNRLQFGISEGGFAKVYSANWIDAYIKGWDQKTNNWKRKERKKVALKVLEDSSRDISRTFLNELEALVKLAELSITGGKLFIVPLYGISQDPDTENFILVFKYIESNFHYYYRTQEFNQLILGTKLTCIWEICMSLGIIHLNNLVHRDFHVGNITYISDFGLYNSKLDYKTIEDVYSTFVSLSLDSRSQANYKSRLLDLPDLSELESELAPDSMQISTGEIESYSTSSSNEIPIQPQALEPRADYFHIVQFYVLLLAPPRFVLSNKALFFTCTKLVFVLLMQ
ncbi:unnamed protein product [Rhizophagus irregularis]|nr:unnamed protein product [Rhizophagus irregularis]